MGNNLNISIFGLGYVGLPLAIKLSNYFNVLGFDKNKERIKELKNFLLKKSNIDKTSELTLKATRNYAKRQYTWFKHQFSPNIVLKTVYNKKKQKNFIKEITDFQYQRNY